MLSICAFYMKLILLLLVLLTNNALAHMYWVSPAEFTVNPKDDISQNISFEFSGSDHCCYPEINRAFDNQQNYKISLFNRDNKIDFNNVWHGKTRAVFEANTKSSGIHVMSLERTEPLYFTKIKSGWLKKSINDPTDSEKEQMVFSAGYFHSSKSYINVGDVNDNLWQKHIGHKLEIVPLDNPTKIVTNSEAKFQLIYNGKPVKNNIILVFYQGFEGLSHDDAYMKLKTDDNGVFSIKFTNANRYLIKASYDDKAIGDKNAQFYGYMATLMLEVQMSKADIAAQFFINICNKYRNTIEDIKKVKYFNSNPLAPSDENNKALSEFVNTVLIPFEKSDVNDILYKVDKAQCTQVLQNLSMLSEEQMEHKAVNDFILYWTKNDPKTIKLADKIAKLEALFNIKEGYKFLYLDNYVSMINNELNMIDNRKLSDKHITIIGSGLPLSGVILNIFTGVKINLIDINQKIIDESGKFLSILDKANVIKLSDFDLRVFDGAKVDYSKIKTDIVYLTSSLPRNTKRDILKNIVNNNKDIIIFDRYVEDLAKLTYYEPLKYSDTYGFREVAKLHSNMSCKNHISHENNVNTSCGDKKNINSARVLISLGQKITI